jgi:transcriptional regulator with XRE-family HTH domain
MAKDDFLAIGKKIRLFRLRKAWSQEELARQAKIGLNTLRDAEAGRRKIAFTTIRKLASAFDVTTDEFTSSQAFSHNTSALVENIAQHLDCLPLSFESAFFGARRITVAAPLRTIPSRKYPVMSTTA